MRQLRQGDVLIERLGHPPDGHGAGEPGDEGGGAALVVLAVGEATGHAHRLAAPAGARFRRASPADGDPLLIGVATLDAPARVLHEEHAPLTLPPGVWRFSRQRRFDPLLHARPAAD